MLYACESEKSKEIIAIGETQVSVEISKIKEPVYGFFFLVSLFISFAY